MPFVAGTLAAAEDVNTVFQDIASALTGSVPVDGSAAFTGPVNFNNQPISGISALTATSGTFTNLTVSSVANIAALSGALNANSQNITGIGNLTASSATITNESVTNLTVSSVANIAALSASLNANNQNITGIGTTSTNVLNANSANLTLGSAMNVNGQNLNNVGTLGASRVNATVVQIGGATDFTLSVSANARILAFAGSYNNLWDPGTARFYWASPSGNIMYLDPSGNLWTAGTVTLKMPALPRSGALAAIRALPASEEADVGRVLALLLSAVRELETATLPMVEA
jgi:hypothetical protein